MKMKFKLLLVFVIMPAFMLAIFGCDEGTTNGDEPNADEKVTYTVTFESMGGTQVDAIEIEQGKTLSAPSVSKEGHTLEGWYTSLDDGQTFEDRWAFTINVVKNDLSLYAKWDVNQYAVTFVAISDDAIAPVKLDYGAALDELVPENDGFIFMGWYKDEEFTERVNTVPSNDITVYAFYELEIMPNMVQVGEEDTDYTIPTGTDDSATATVEGGYLMATTQTTYELWYEVRVWALANGYNFQYQGRQGTHGTDGAAPTTRKLEPVTRVSWRDTIVWLNALSAMQGLNPVYRTSGGDIIKDSRHTNGTVVDAAVQTSNNGYRLPTRNEWEMAARWKNDIESTDGSILVGGRYWTPGSYASGAVADYNNESATRAVAWYWDAPGGNRTRSVGQLLPNHLGIYDMSGNVREWTYTPSGSRRVLCGGSWNNGEGYMQVGISSSSTPYHVGNADGFRFVRNP